MPKRIRVSLANKCQLLFGVGVLLIMIAALTVVSMRMNRLVEEGPRQLARNLTAVWFEDPKAFDEQEYKARDEARLDSDISDLRVRFIELGALTAEQAGTDPWLIEQAEFFRGVPDQTERFTRATDGEGTAYYRYLRAIREKDLPAGFGEQPPEQAEPATDTQAEGALAKNPELLSGMLLVEIVEGEAQKQRMLNRIYLVAAGLTAGLLAITAFWVTISRLILSPLRVLRGYAEKVSQGDLNIRSDVNTGDEFEQLSDMFNAMLDNVRGSQDQLKSANKSLDLKLGELAESNVALYEANKIKGEFLANVSHELRTPLNSIVGFAEVLQETFADGDDPQAEKRRRYTGNIILSSRRLLDLINDLLDLAKIEAGRVELRLSTVSIQDTCEGLVNLIRPQADQRGVRLRLKAQPNLPPAETDPGKLQQVLFNFLSNAIKFSPEGGEVLLSAELEEPRGQRQVAMVRLGVKDQGPGIDQENHARVFEKFSQLDPSVTREHGGTGLGLTISKELADLLGGHLELASEPGDGATFSLVIPLIYQPPTAPLMPG
ncbi:MAG: HAMP domain-containing sensor histidine kinase [Planctomycetota bacterium]